MMELDNQLSQLLENMTLKGAWNVVANVVSSCVAPVWTTISH